MSRLRISISGEQGTGKSKIAGWMGAALLRGDHTCAGKGSVKVSVDGEVPKAQMPWAPIPSRYGVTEIEIITLTENANDFADSLLGKIEGKRFDKADAEVAHHVRRLLECGLLPVGVARRMLSKSAKGKPGGDLITDPGSGMVTDRQGINPGAVKS